MARMRERDPIVISGVGLVTALGVGTAATWSAVRRGDVGLRALTAVEAALPPGSVGGQAAELPVEFATGLPREARLVRWAALEALAQAGATEGAEPERMCAVLGTTLHGIRACGRFLRSGDFLELRDFLAGATAGRALDGLGIGGRVMTTCSACSSSLGAIALGVTLIRAGEADAVLAGGYDPISEYAWGGFNALRLIAPERMRPFARGRIGMKIGEGAALVVLERASRAAARGAQVLGVLAGVGESADAHHLTQPHPEGEGALRAMRSALERAGMDAGELGLIAAHATGTPDNDAAEHRALATLLGARLAAVPVTALKSHLGHTLGAAGAAELILTLMAMREQVALGVAGYVASDTEFPGLNMASATRPASVRAALTTSLGFGGANTCAVVRMADAEDGIVVRAGSAEGGAHASELPEAAARGASGTQATAAERRACITGVGVLLPPAGRTRLEDSDLEGLVNARRTRRMSPYVRFTLAAAALGLRDAGIEVGDARLARAAGLLATMHGSPTFCLDYYEQIVREGVLAANPVLFAEGVPNAAAAHLSTTFGIRGACQTIIGTRTAGLDALALAKHRVEQGEVEVVIVVAAEEAHATVTRAHAVNRNERPGGGEQCEGAVALIVESGVSARERGKIVHAWIGGVAGANAAGVGVSAYRAALRVAKARCGASAATRSVSARRRVLYALGPLLAIAENVRTRAPIMVSALDIAGTASAAVIEAE
ncbi:hypothetical protein BH11PLA1_BH11PLA1_00880 [soil metagenome]